MRKLYLAHRAISQIVYSGYLPEKSSATPPSGPIPPSEFPKESMNKTNCIVAIYPSHATAEEAVKQLQRSGFDLKKLSIVGRDYHTDEHVVGFYDVGGRMRVWGQTGAFWGALWGILFGSAFFWIPGLGPLMVAGPLVSWIIGALEGAVILGGLSAIGAGLYSLGIPEDSILQYETALRTDKFVLVVHGAAEDVAGAKTTLDHTRPEALDHHQQSTNNLLPEPAGTNG